MHSLHTDDNWLWHKLGVSLSKNGPWVAGGAALQWYRNRPTRDDIDLFFGSKLQFDYFRNTFEAKLRGRPPVNPTDSAWLTPPYDYPFDTHETENAITYAIRSSITGNDLGTVQLIRRKYYSSIEECIADFDISVSQVATDGDKFWFGEHTVEDIKNRQFRFTKALGPASGRRFIKYHAYGFNAIDSAYDEMLSSDLVNLVRGSNDDYA